MIERERGSDREIESKRGEREKKRETKIMTWRVT